VNGRLDVTWLEAVSVARLTDRQAKLMWMVAQGMTDKEIASTLDVAVSTVKNTMVMIYEKLEARNRAQAVYRFATIADNEGVALWYSLLPLPRLY
jgi:DNA-binding NarL/FixJ family response regulator